MSHNPTVAEVFAARTQRAANLAAAEAEYNSGAWEWAIDQVEDEQIHEALLGDDVARQSMAMAYVDLADAKDALHRVLESCTNERDTVHLRCLLVAARIAERQRDDALAELAREVLADDGGQYD